MNDREKTMTTTIADQNVRPEFDEIIQDITDYVLDYQVDSRDALDTAYHCLLDTLGCGFLALNYPECRKMLGPTVPGTHCENGSRVPGTHFQLDPIQAAFNIGTLVRWLDFNDTWLAQEWGHPSDNLGAILAVSDYVNRQRIATRMSRLTVHDILQCMVKAHEIQGILALDNSFNRQGLDHVVLVKIASTAVTCYLLGLTRDQTLNAISLAWVDGQSLRTYRHAPNTGSRKSWAAGDATARGVWLALMAERGEMGYPSALTAKGWGFQDVLMDSKPITLAQPLGSYVMENVLFKIAYPAEFHAQTAVEAAFALYPEIKDKWDTIERIELETQEAAVRIISKTGALYNPADRDHCLQYMVAIGLLHGQLTAEHYEDKVACDPRIDSLREKMFVTENKTFSDDYLDPNKRAIGNSIQIHFSDGSSTDKVRVEYPIGHKTRRTEGIPVLLEKFKTNVEGCFAKQRAAQILATTADQTDLAKMSVTEFVDLLSF